MNTIAKVSVAGALALGSLSANASIALPTSSGPATSDVFLFAEVVSGSTILGSYAGDTNVQVSSTLAGGTLDSTSTDTPLNTLITLGKSTGNTILWGIMGGAYAQQGVANAGDIYLTTLTNPNGLATTTGGSLGAWSTGLRNTLVAVNDNVVGTATSVFASTVAAGGIWDGTLSTTATSNASNWFNNGTGNVVTGLTSASLYLVTSGASAKGNTVATDGTVTLSASGLTYTPPSASAVPLPAAVWLLGGGLMGLFGIGRRKAATA